MSQIQPAGSQAKNQQAISQQAEVRAAIARAAGSTGVDFDYLLAQAKIESNLDPQARASTSSASGLYQFTNGTWLDTLARHGGDHGLGWASEAASNPALRTQAMALRFDPQVAALMGAELANDNKAALTTTLGHEPEPAELYLAHFLGITGATRFLNALASDPSQSAAALLPKPAGANRTIFFRADGGPRSVSEVMGLMRGKLAAAMEGGDAEQWVLGTNPPQLEISQSPPGGPIAQAFHSAAQSSVTQAAPPVTPPSQRSMAETLRQTFALGSPEAASLPAHVRTAYARLAALGF